MNRETSSTASAVVVVLDGETDAGCQLARTLLTRGRRVVVVVPHPGDAVRVMHGQSAEAVLAIACDVADARQWTRLTARITDRFGRIDAVVRGGMRDAA